MSGYYPHVVDGDPVVPWPSSEGCNCGGGGGGGGGEPSEYLKRATQSNGETVFIKKDGSTAVTIKVVAPNSSAAATQAADAKQTYQELAARCKKSDFKSIPANLDKDNSSLGDVVDKLNAVIKALRGAVAVAFVMSVSAGAYAGVTVKAAKMSTLPGKAMVVTNVSYTADYPADYTTTNAVRDIVASTTVTNVYTKTETDAMTNSILAAVDQKADKTAIPSKWAWANVTNAPTTVAGYGITDVYTKSAADAKFATLPVSVAQIKDAAGNTIMADRSFVAGGSAVTTNITKWTVTSGGGPWQTGETYYRCEIGDNPFVQDAITWTNKNGIVMYSTYSHEYYIGLCGNYPESAPVGSSGSWTGYHAEGVEAWPESPELGGTITVDATVVVEGLQTLALESEVQAVSNQLGQIDTAKANKATTLSGYGITDAYTTSQVYSQTEADNKYIKYPVVGTTAYKNSIRVGTSKLSSPDVYSDDAILLGRNAKHWNNALRYGVSNVFVWNSGRNEDGGDNDFYGQHGAGTFNINPYGGLDGFYVGKNNMNTLVQGIAASSSVTNQGAVTFASDLVLYSVKQAAIATTNGFVSVKKSIAAGYVPTNAVVALSRSVQYVTPDGGTVTVQKPQKITGGIRDWVIYIYPSADTELSLVNLPHARFTDSSVTNTLPANVYTAIYLTEIDPETETFAVGRAELLKGW